MLSSKAFDFDKLTKSAKNVRQTIIELAYNNDGGHHLGGGLSMVELMCYLYGTFLNNTSENVHDINRDRFILSKGHGVLGFFPVLLEYGFITKEDIMTYKQFKSYFISHPIKAHQYGIESSNGSLGHGLSYGLGIAIGLNLINSDARVVVFVGDGECNEGSIWEAIMLASTLHLSNLYLIIDNNSFQSDGETNSIVMQGNLSARLTSFGWCAVDIDGHCFTSIHAALNTSSSKPKAIVASTVKGKGIDFMESNNAYHHAAITKAIFNSAIECIN